MYACPIYRGIIHSVTAVDGAKMTASSWKRTMECYMLQPVPPPRQRPRISPPIPSLLQEVCYSLALRPPRLHQHLFSVHSPRQNSSHRDRARRVLLLEPCNHPFFAQSVQRHLHVMCLLHRPIPWTFLVYNPFSFATSYRTSSSLLSLALPPLPSPPAPSPTPPCTTGCTAQSAAAHSQ